MAPTQVAGAGERSIWTAGTLETIVGWGATEEGGDVPDNLQEARVPITTDQYCAGAYSDFDAQTMVCAGFPQGGVDTCQGDSGGPMFGKTSAGALRVVGTTSFGEGCARPGRPGVYGRVADDTLRPWIAQTTGGGVSAATSARVTRRAEDPQGQAACCGATLGAQAPARRQQQRPPSLEHERDQKDDQDDQQDGSDTDIHGTPFLASVSVLIRPDSPFGGALSSEPVRERVRELGYAVGRFAPGALNAIVDVPGVLVGHRTVIEGDRLRTGVTAILPHGGNLYEEKVLGGYHAVNAYGKAAGLTQLAELGTIESPLLLTNTLVGRAPSGRAASVTCSTRTPTPPATATRST